ncbi:uncharacterized protein BDZ83DRAFT_653986 [Colletotrichum acutatum]|uniref:Uncharacterized protein n=1 Tax=Glomerella acutata TaxID=27357 RepID=A0AAD8UJI4_GLOAC|nr:uncharacterized protein BDZ83DRAFT_653986 [Colletotrichum acutatum]KAK1722394.1 hypothetical protein BDZ83DRAFT_653986 [Colletotrichum acutatum]
MRLSATGLRLRKQRSPRLAQANAGFCTSGESWQTLTTYCASSSSNIAESFLSLGTQGRHEDEDASRLEQRGEPPSGITVVSLLTALAMGNEPRQSFIDAKLECDRSCQSMFG